MAAAPPPQRRPPKLMDELVEEILLRLPLDKPTRLVRAALVCKRWCRVVMDPGFQRRFHQFHRTPPLLGFIVGLHDSHGTQFLPRSSFRPSSNAADCGGGSWCPIDARHGRILFYYHDDHDWMRTLSKGVLIVWTPATGEVRRLPMPLFLSSRDAFWNAALLCAAALGCDHMECTASGSSPFNVVLVSRTRSQIDTRAYVYSSEESEWTVRASVVQRGYVQRCTCNALVGNALYFIKCWNAGIMEYDLVQKELSVIDLPSVCDASTIIVLMSVEDGGGGLGFALVQDFSLRIWLRESGPTKSGGWTWTLHRIAELKSFPALSNLKPSSYIIAAADAVGVFVIWAHGAGVVAIDVKSGRARRVFRDRVVNFIPYMSFCTPALRAAAANNEEPFTVASNNA